MEIHFNDMMDITEIKPINISIGDIFALEDIEINKENIIYMAISIPYLKQDTVIIETIRLEQNILETLILEEYKDVQYIEKAQLHFEG